MSTGAGLVQTVTGRLKMPGNTGVWWYMPTPLVRERSGVQSSAAAPSQTLVNADFSEIERRLLAALYLP